MHQQTTGAFATAAVALALIGLTWLALRPAHVPQPQPASALPSAFSAERAFVHVAALAATPRPIATPAHTEARNYLLARLRAMGLEAEVQTSTVRDVGKFHVTVAVVHNILVRKPGIAPDHVSRPALMLASHYDSSKRDYGAADAGASVAAMLETLRALQNGAALENDLICLIADGEHEGELGAQAFLAEHRWAGQVGLALNFDNRGSRGPILLYDAGGGSGAAISGWAGAVPLPLGSSVLGSVFRSMRGRHASGVLKALDAPVLNFANVEGGSGAAGALDSAERLDHGTLQHIGDTMLGLTRHFGALPLNRLKSSDHLYFELPGIGLVHYSRHAMWPLTVLVCVLFFGLCRGALRRGLVDATSITQGAFGFAIAGSLSCLAAAALWQLVALTDPGYHPASFGAGAHDHWYMLAFVTLAVAVFMLAQRRLQGRIAWRAAALGALACVVLALVVGSVLLPGASYLLAWPLLAIMGALAWLDSERGAAVTPALRLALLLAAASPAVLLFAPVVQQMATAFTIERTNLPIAALALLLGLATSLLAALYRRAVPAALVLACAGCVLAGRSSEPYGAEPPRQNEMTYFKDAHTWQSYWLLGDEQVDGWSKQFFPDLQAPREPTELFGVGSAPMWISNAPRTAVAFPAIAVLVDEETPARRHIEFTVASRNMAPAIEVWIEGARPLHASMNNLLLTHGKQAHWSVSAYGMGAQTLHFAIDLEPDKSFKVRVAERMPGLPPTGAAPRSPALQPQMVRLTETTVAADTLLFR